MNLMEICIFYLLLLWFMVLTHVQQQEMMTSVMTVIIMMIFIMISNKVFASFSPFCFTSLESKCNKIFVKIPQCSLSGLLSEDTHVNYLTQHNS